MRTYRTAHALAARGHEVHVVTNAREAAPPFRMHMRAEDWDLCEARGSVQVHWTDPVDHSQSYLPMASPFVSKLAAIAARVHSVRPFDVIFSYYMEPYGIAGYLASQMTGVPHVVRMAGSDAGRLWHHSQLEALYDHVLRSADIVVAVGVVADRAAQRGVDIKRIASGGAFALPDDLFAPEGPTLDLAALKSEVEGDADLRGLFWGDFAADKPYFGIYGKLGDNKGSFALLAALHRLKLDGINTGLVALAHGRPEVERRFRERVRELGLSDRVLQIPFLPHWRVPEFLRGCLAVCCLEQDFPIRFHSPIIPLEVLLCGACLVASTEVIRKLPQWQRLPHGYGCVAIEDVNDVEELSSKLAAILVEPQLVAVVGARGRTFARDCLDGIEFPERLEFLLEAAAKRRHISSENYARAVQDETEQDQDHFPRAHSAALALAEMGGGWGSNNDMKEGRGGLSFAQQVLTALKDEIAAGKASFYPLAQAVQVEIAIARAERESVEPESANLDLLFRLPLRRWAMAERELDDLAPIRDRHLRILHFDHDVSDYQSVETISEFPISTRLGSSHMVAFCGDARRDPLVVDRFTARILELSDGTRTSREIVRQLDREFGRAESLDHFAWIENLFLSGLVGFAPPA
jgi:glycosyltransferase involved in cell wall biosynthesis